MAILRAAILLLTAACCILCQQMQWSATRKWPPGPAGVKLISPSAVAVDFGGRLIIGHAGEPPLVRLRPDARPDLTWGKGLLKMPHGIKVAPDGAVWVTDVKRNIVVKFSAEGDQQQVIGAPDAAGSDRAHFDGPTDIAFSPKGDIFVADGYHNSRIVRFNAKGEYQSEWGKRGTGPGEFQVPHAIVVDPQEHIYIADRDNRRIQVFDGDGKYLSQWNAGAPSGLAMDANGSIWVSDEAAGVVMALDRDGRRLDAFPAMRPHMLAVDALGAVYVAEPANGTVRRFAKSPWPP